MKTSRIAWTKKNGNGIFALALIGLLGGCCSPAPMGAAARVKPAHVILVGFDGLAGEQVSRASTPTLDRLMAKGAWTLDARAILPSASACNWHSMFTAAASEQHGYNQWNSSRPVFPPAEVAANGRYPDVFYLLRKSRPDAEIGLIYEWGGLVHCLDTRACSFVKQGGTEVLTAASCDYIRTKKPTFLAVCYDNPDHAGHTKGWGSPEYLETVTQLDACLDRILRAIEEAGIQDDTVVIVTSDHGGIDKKHGGATASEMNRPVVIAGKGVVPGRRLSSAGAIYDVGATIAALLDVPPARSWIGRPYDEAFDFSLEERQAAAEKPCGEILLSFDDHWLDDWKTAFPIFRKYGATATFCIVGEIGTNEIAFARAAMAEGHEIALHGLKHRNADEAIAQFGADAYWQMEIAPQLKAFQAAGIDVRTFAYPNCRRDAASDALFARHGFTRLRGSVSGVANPNPHNPKNDPAKVWRPVADADAFFAPAQAHRNDLLVPNIIIGAYYHTDMDDITRAIRRLGARHERLALVSHGLSEQPNGISMSTAWLEQILATARANGVRVHGLGQQKVAR